MNVLKIEKPKRKNRLPKPPKSNEARESNLSKNPSTKKVTLNLLVSAEFRRTVKLYATSKDESMVEVMIEAFNAYKSRNP